MKEESTKKLRKSGNSNLVTTIAIVVAVLALAAAGYFAWKAQQNADPKAKENQAKQETNALKDKVGKLITLPKDETPTVATVSDKEKLKDQPFFKDTVNNDKILIYPQAKKAIIFRESENKIINVGPIAITSDQAGTTGEQKPAEKK